MLASGFHGGGWWVVAVAVRVWIWSIYSVLHTHENVFINEGFGIGVKLRLCLKHELV